MGDSGEGLIDAEARIQERMEDLERERLRTHGGPAVDPERLREFESLRLAHTEFERQLSSATHVGRRAQLQQTLDELKRRMAEASAQLAV